MQPALIIIVIFLIVAYFVFSYRPKLKADIKDLYSEGLDLMVDGYKQGAYENFKKIIAQDTSNVKAYIKLGQVIREGGNPKNALKIHTQLIFRKNLSYYEKKELYKNLTLDYFALNEIDQSIVNCKKILSIDKKNSWALTKLIEMYQIKKDWSNSKKYLELKLKFTGKNEEHLLALYKIQEGRIFLRNKNFVNARGCFNDALAIFENSAIAHYFIGNSFSKESDEVYNQAESMKIKDSAHQEVYDEKMKHAQDLLADAISEWVIYAKLKPESSWMVIHLLKDALFALNRYNEIEIILKDILSKDSDNVDVVAALADYYDHLGDTESAFNIIEKGLSKDDSSLLVRLIRLKLLPYTNKKEQDKLKKELDFLIKDLVQDSDYQRFKNTSTDDDALWLYSMYDEKDVN